MTLSPVNRNTVENRLKRIGLVFEAAWNAPQGLLPNWHPDRPRMSIPPPEAAWLEWRLAWPDAQDTIAISLPMNRMSELWLWMAALAHRVLPATIWFDEEGSRVALSAQWHDDASNRVHLTLQRMSDHWEGPHKNYSLARHDWIDTLGRFLRRTGRLVAGSMRNPYPMDWGYPSTMWIPLETSLPWHWPGQVAQWNLAAPWSARQQQAWLYLSAAVGLDVNHGRHPASVIYTVAARAALARLQYQGLELSVCWMQKAAALMGIPLDTEANALFAAGQAERADAFETLDDWCHLYPTEDGTLEQALALPVSVDMDEFASYKGLGHASETGRNRLRQQLLNQAMNGLDWQPGTWLRDEHMRPGRVLLHARDTFTFERAGGICSERQRKCLQEARPYALVDWGINGITREYGAMGLWPLNAWRWPVLQADDFAPGQGALYERWRVWATHPVTAAFPCTCPACGYLHLEDDDPIEIHGCLFCGEWLGRHDITTLHPPQERQGDHWADPGNTSLQTRRQHVRAHGDVFQLADPSDDVAWLRRPDVKALRKRLMNELDDWLQAPEPKPTLPLELWQALEWSGRSFDSELHRNDEILPFLPRLVPQQPDTPALSAKQRRLNRRHRKRRLVGEYHEWGLELKAKLRQCKTEADMDAFINEWLPVVERLGLGFGGGFDWQSGLIEGVLALAKRGSLPSAPANVSLDCLHVHADLLEVHWINLSSD